MNTTSSKGLVGTVTLWALAILPAPRHLPSPGVGERPTLY